MTKKNRPVDSDFPRLVSQLMHLAQAEPSLPLQDGTRAPLLTWGVSTLGSDREKPLAAVWLRHSASGPALKARRAVDFSKQSYFLTVQWRILLSKAFLRHESARNVPKAVRDLAHYAWWALIPLVQRYDVVFADLLTRARGRYLASPGRVRNEPFWVGIDDEADELRFDAHSSYLLSLRSTLETPQQSFCEAAARWFNAHLAQALNRNEQRLYGLCAVRDHRLGGACPTCPPISADRRFMGIYDGDVLLSRKDLADAGGVNEEDFDTEEQLPSVSGGPMDQAILNYRWIIDARHRLDGIVRCTTTSGAAARVIHLPRLKAAWERLGVRSILDEYDFTSSEGLTQARAYLTKFLNVSEVPRSMLVLETIYADAEWGSEQEFGYDEPYLIPVLDSVLINQLMRMGQRGAALLKAHRAPRDTARLRKKPDRRKVTLYYRSPKGATYPIYVVRARSSDRQEKNFFSTPHEVFAPADRKDRVGLALMVGDQFYWSLRGLNRLVNDQRFPWVSDFLAWAEEQDALYASRHQFREALYGEKLTQRIDALTAGELEQLGRFSAHEDQTILDFIGAPGRRKILTSAEWSMLLPRLPGRSARGILRRLEELGKAYAFANGYDAYTKSLFHRKFSASRRRSWTKEGCPP
jgi:hypothetical protein